MTDRVIALVGLIGTLAGTAYALYIGIKTPQFADVGWRIAFGTLGISIGFLFGFLLNRRRPSGGDSAIRVLSGNGEMHNEVVDLIRRARNKGRTLGKVIVIQCSGMNVAATVAELLKAGAVVELYLAVVKRGENEHQRGQIDQWSRVNLKNLLPPFPLTHRYRYDAPASIRAVLIEGEMLFVGSYYYEVVELERKQLLDSRGHDMPLFAVPHGHSGFTGLQTSIQEMVRNWVEKENSEKNAFTATKEQ